MSKFTKYLTPFLFAASAVSLSLPANAENVAIVGGSVHTMDGGAVYENGVVVITDDTISAVGGADTVVPEGYRVIDATGKVVTPGLMTAFSRVGLQEVSLEGSTVSHSLTNTFYNAGFEVQDSLNVASSVIPITRIEGVTRALISPGNGVFQRQDNNQSIFSGQSAVIHLGEGYDLLVKSQAAVMAFGGGSAGGTRTSYLDLLRASLKDATPIPAKKRGRAATPPGPGRFVKAPEDLAALGRVVTGETPLVISEAGAGHILQLLELKEEFPDLNLIILGADEGWMVADEIAAANVPLIISVHPNLPGSFESLGSTLYNAGRLEAAGVTFAIISGDPVHNARLLNQEAGNAVAHGMTWQGAMEAITINPATIFGINDSFGSLTTGKEADVVVWDGDPLEVSSSPMAIFIQGNEMSLESRQTRLRDRYINLDAEKDKPLAYKK
jgi:imidazolonepropionase-like amidohydrolase